MTPQQLNEIQVKSGLNRGEFARVLGYSYSSFKEFYSGRSKIQLHLEQAIKMYQEIKKL